MIYSYRSFEDDLICLQKKNFDYLFLCWKHYIDPWSYDGGQLHKIDDTSKYNILGPTILTEWRE